MQWFRFYGEALNDPKVQSLTGDNFKTWINLLCIASQNGGVLPELEALQFMLRCNAVAVTEALQTLTAAGLLAVTKNQHGEVLRPHNWDKRQYKSDTSNERVKRYRERNKTVTCNVTVTAPDTETEQNRTDKKETTKVVSKKRGSRLQKDWVLPPDWMAWAHEYADSRKLSAEDTEIITEADKFRDHFSSSSQQNAVKLDWEATWRNWWRRFIDGEEKRIERDLQAQQRWEQSRAGRDLAR